MDDEREIHPLTPLFSALEASRIRFMIIGMSAAIMQGAPGTTLDYDIWIDLPSRQYIKVINICRKLGAALLSFDPQKPFHELEKAPLISIEPGRGPKKCRFTEFWFRSTFVA